MIILHPTISVGYAYCASLLKFGKHFDKNSRLVKFLSNFLSHCDSARWVWIMCQRNCTRQFASSLGRMQLSLASVYAILNHNTGWILGLWNCILIHFPESKEKESSPTEETFRQKEQVVHTATVAFGSIFAHVVFIGVACSITEELSIGKILSLPSANKFVCGRCRWNCPCYLRNAGIYYGWPIRECSPRRLWCCEKHPICGWFDMWGMWILISSF